MSIINTPMTKSLITLAVIAFLFGRVTVASAQGQLRLQNRVQQLSSDEEIAQATYRLGTSKDVVMNLSGTTPVKDWSMTANGLTGEAVMGIDRSGALASVQALVFKLPVYNLKGEVKAMDEDAYEALKADRHKEIVFKLIDAVIESQTSNSQLVAAKGKLTVAGVTRVVTLKMTATMGREGSIIFTGAQKLKMSDYDVERPSLLFGAIKAANEMTLTYKLIFNKTVGSSTSQLLH
jgi:hypothetical protein